MSTSASRTLIGLMPSSELSASALSSAFMMKRVEMPNRPSRWASSCSERADSFSVVPFLTTSSPSYRRSLVIRSHLELGSRRDRMANMLAISSVCGAMWARNCDSRSIFS